MSAQAISKVIVGPVGDIELIIETPQNMAVANVVFVMCHPHPLFHGSMNNKVVTTTTKAMQALGIVTARFNFRGVGKSQGTYGQVIGEREDLVAVLSEIHTQYPDRELWLGGFSFGGAIAYCGANDFSGIKQLLTIAPSVEMVDLSSVAEPSMPWTIIQGDKDDVVKPEKVLAFLQTVSTSYHLIKLSEVGHFFHHRLSTLKDELMQLYAPRVPTCL